MYTEKLPKTKKAYEDYKMVERELWVLRDIEKDLHEEMHVLEAKKLKAIENYIHVRLKEAQEIGYRCIYCFDTKYCVSTDGDGGYHITSCSCPRVNDEH